METCEYCGSSSEDWILHQSDCNAILVSSLQQQPLYGAYTNQRTILQHRNVSGDIYMRVAGSAENGSSTRRGATLPSGPYTLHITSPSTKGVLSLTDNDYERDVIALNNVANNHEAEQLAGRDIRPGLAEAIRWVPEGVIRLWPNRVDRANVCYTRLGTHIQLSLSDDRGYIKRTLDACANDLCKIDGAKCDVHSANGKVLARALQLKGLSYPYDSIYCVEAADNVGRPVRMLLGLDSNGHDAHLLDVEWDVDVSEREAPNHDDWQHIEWECDGNDLDQVTGLTQAMHDRIAAIKSIANDNDPTISELQSLLGVIDAHRSKLEEDPSHTADAMVNSAIYSALTHLWEPVEGALRVKRYKSQIAKGTIRAWDLATRMVRQVEAAYKPYLELEQQLGEGSLGARAKTRVKYWAAKAKLQRVKSDAKDLMMALQLRAGESIYNEPQNAANKTYLLELASSLSSAINDQQFNVPPSPPTQ